MQIFECDFCWKTKHCVKVQFKDSLYDICDECSKDLEDKLKDRGDFVSKYYVNQHWPIPFYYYSLPNQYWPPPFYYYSLPNSVSCTQSSSLNLLKCLTFGGGSGEHEV